jgi:hypothetical protein
MTDKFDLDREGMLDATPLKFGKFRGKTPEEISNMSPRDAQYLVWAYETVGNFDVCSEALYRELGGKWKRAEATRKKANSDYVAPPDRYESRGHSHAKPASSFDDMDDDIPF